MESNQSLATKTTAPSTFNDNLGARSPNVDTEWKTATRDDVAGSEYTRLQSLRSSMACRSKDLWWSGPCLAVQSLQFCGAGRLQWLVIIIIWLPIDMCYSISVTSLLSSYRHSASLSGSHHSSICTNWLS